MGVFSLAIDMTGRRCGMLTVIERDSTRNRNAYWVALCDCGNTTIVSGIKLRRGHTKSCGCLRSTKTIERNTVHGMTGTRAYRAWSAMWRRCTNKSAPNYKWYGGRGIKVCEAWRDFTAFLRDMGEPPAATELDRINNDGDYSKGNCRWVTHKANCNNRRKNGLGK